MGENLSFSEEKRNGEWTEGGCEAPLDFDWNLKSISKERKKRNNERKCTSVKIPWVSELWKEQAWTAA